MHRNAVKFKDTWAAPGSQLHAALEGKNMELAKKIYDQCEADAKKLLDKATKQSMTPEQAQAALLASYRGEPAPMKRTQLQCLARRCVGCELCK